MCTPPFAAHDTLESAHSVVKTLSRDKCEGIKIIDTKPTTIVNFRRKFSRLFPGKSVRAGSGGQRDARAQTGV